MNHLPPFLEKIDELKAKGVDVVAVVAANAAFVQSGWARFLGLKDKVRLRLPVPFFASRLGFGGRADSGAAVWCVRVSWHRLQ